MQHLNPDTFQRLEKFIDSYAEASGGLSPSLTEIAQGLGISKSTVSKYLNIMKSEGRVSFGGHRSVATKRMRSMSGELCAVPLLGEVACGLPILAEENIEEYYILIITLYNIL